MLPFSRCDYMKRYIVSGPRSIFPNNRTPVPPIDANDQESSLSLLVLLGKVKQTNRSFLFETKLHLQMRVKVR